jgi:hypothetical protein
MERKLKWTAEEETGPQATITSQNSAARWYHYSAIKIPRFTHFERNGCETWSQRREHRLSAEWRILPYKRESNWRKLHNERLHHLYYLTDITRKTRVRRI